MQQPRTARQSINGADQRRAQAHAVVHASVAGRTPCQSSSRRSCSPAPEAVDGVVRTTGARPGQERGGRIAVAQVYRRGARGQQRHRQHRQAAVACRGRGVDHHVELAELAQLVEVARVHARGQADGVDQCVGAGTVAIDDEQLAAAADSSAGTMPQAAPPATSTSVRRSRRSSAWRSARSRNQTGAVGVSPCQPRPAAHQGVDRAGAARTITQRRQACTAMRLSGSVTLAPWPPASANAANAASNPSMPVSRSRNAGRPRARGRRRVQRRRQRVPSGWPNRARCRVDARHGAPPDGPGVGRVSRVAQASGPRPERNRVSTPSARHVSSTPASRARRRARRGNRCLPQPSASRTRRRSLIHERRHAEGILHPPYDVKVGQAGLTSPCRHLVQVERDLAQRLLGVAGSIW